MRVEDAVMKGLGRAPRDRPPPLAPAHHTHNNFRLQSCARHEQEGAHFQLQLPVLRQGVLPVLPRHGQPARDSDDLVEGGQGAGKVVRKEKEGAAATAAAAAATAPAAAAAVQPQDMAGNRSGKTRSSWRTSSGWTRRPVFSLAASGGALAAGLSAGLIGCDCVPTLTDVRAGLAAGLCCGLMAEAGALSST